MLSVDWYVRNRIKHVHPVSDGNSRCRLGAARHSTTSRVLPAQSASRVTVRHGMNVPDSLFLTYPAVPYDDLAVPDIFPSGTIGSPKNSITMMLIRHFDRCLHFHDQSRRFLRELWLCKVTARWPDLTHLSVHSLVNGVRSTRTSFLVRVIGSTATTVRKVSEVTKEMKLHDYDLINHSLFIKMLDSGDIRCFVLSFRWWFMELFFVCADLLRWVPIFLRTVYSAQFCLHPCRSWPRPSCAFKMLSVDWYVRNRIWHVHPVSDGNSRCRLGRQDTRRSRVSCRAQSASRVTVRHGMSVPDSLCMTCWPADPQGAVSVKKKKKRCCLSSISILFVKIRRSHNGNAHTGKDCLYIGVGPGPSLVLLVWKYLEQFRKFSFKFQSLESGLTHGPLGDNSWTLGRCINF